MREKSFLNDDRAALFICNFFNILNYQIFE